MNRRAMGILVAALEPLAAAFLNSLPALAGVRVGFVVFHAFVDDLAVPIWNRDGLAAGCDPVSQRL